MKRKQLTLVLIMNDKTQKILLGMKKRGFGCGRWNGFGGKVQGNESVEECAIREVKEECGLTMETFFKIGHIVFEFVGDPELLDVHVFRCDGYVGSVEESDEMKPQWFQYNDVPFDKMWPDDSQWYPSLFRNEKFKGYYLFEGHDKVLKSELQKIDSF